MDSNSWIRISSSGTLKLLLGADVYASIIQPGRRGGPDKPIAQQTQLGWLILSYVGFERTLFLAMICSVPLSTN